MCIRDRDRGARAILFVTPTYEKEPQDLLKYALKSGYSDMGIPAVILRRGAAQRLFERLGFSLLELEKGAKPGSARSFPLSGLTIDMNLSLRRTKSRTTNVLGMIEPLSPYASDEVVVIGAHYDHLGYGGGTSRMRGGHGAPWGGGRGEVYNGADDNASGAEYFSSRRESLDRRLLFIAFGAEELGILGSTYYVKNPVVPLSKTLAMVNMDMIGRLRGNKLTVLGVGSSPQWRGIIEDANKEVGLSVEIGQSGFAPSDQSAFLAKRIPSLQFFTGLHSDYHTPRDDWEKINPGGEVRVLRPTAGVIDDLARGKRSVSFVAPSGGEERGGFMGFSVYLGTMPDYSAEVKGVRLMGVRPGSPAERAGLRGGDVIVGYKGRDIRDIYDFVYALSESEPGVPVRLNIVRGGKNLVLSVIPEARE